MTLDDLLRQGRLEKRPGSKNDITNLLKLASRNLSDAAVDGVSTDGRFNYAYECVLSLATVPIRCSGYRVKSIGHHYTVFQTLPMIMGKEFDDLADYFQACRGKRNRSLYFTPDVASDGEVDELIKEAAEFEKVICQWVKNNHPEYGI